MKAQLIVDLSKLAAQSLAQRKLRSGLTMLGVIIGVGAVIVMVGIGTGAKQRVASQIKSLGSNLLVVRPGLERHGPVRSGNVQTLSAADADAIGKEVADVALVAPEAGSSAQVKYLAQNASTTVLGTTGEWLEVNNFELERGRFIDAFDQRGQRKVAVLGATVARELFAADDDPMGKVVKVKGSNFTVVGTLVAKGQSGYRDPDDQLVIPLSTAQKRLFGTDHVRAINVQVRSEQRMATAQAQIEALLRRQHRIVAGMPDDFNIRNQTEILATMDEVTDTFTQLLAAVAAVSLLVGGIGIMNIMLVSVTERTREIGVRKAVGARGRDIMFQFLVEAIVLSGLGGVVGIGAGVGVAKLVSAGGTWQTAVSSQSVVLAFGVAAAIGVFFGLYPARKAAALDPIEALRHE